MRMSLETGGTSAAIIGAGSEAGPAIGKKVFADGFRTSRKKPAGRWLRRIAWTVCTLAAMAGTVEILLNPPAFLLQPPAPAETQSPRWSEIHRPIPVYAFSGGQFDRPADSYSARRHTDGSRADIITFGQAPGGKDHDASHDWMRVTLLRSSNPTLAAPGFFVEMARLAAADGLAVIRNTFPNIINTRFGDFAVSDLEISSGSKSAPCLGYRMQISQPAFQISGIACGAPHAPIDRRMLACIIDRLDLLSSRDDPELSRFFASSELQRNKNCAQIRSVMGNKSAWLDQISPGKALKSLRLVSLSTVGDKKSQ